MKELTEKEAADLVKRFYHHPPKGDQGERYGEMRHMHLVLAQHVVKATPPSREQSLAITKIEEAMFWANAAIARNETE